MSAQIHKINSQVSQLNSKITDAQQDNILLNQAALALNTNLLGWNNCYWRTLGSEITTQVVIEGTFRGGVADYLADSFPAKVEAMNTAGSTVSTAYDQSKAQSTKIKEYITDLQDQKSSLQRQISELSSMIAAARYGVNP